MRVRLKGINSVRRRLADGTIKTFWYAWKGGPPLRGQPGTPEFITSYNEAVAKKVVPASGTLASILQQYQASEDFRGLADSTRRSYVALIARIEKSFADFPLAALTDRRTRGVFIAWRDRIAASSGRRQADYAWTVLARVLSWADDRGLVAANPCKGGGRLYRGSRADKVWTADDEINFLTKAPEHLRLPLLLAIWTGQRRRLAEALEGGAFGDALDERFGLVFEKQLRCCRPRRNRVDSDVQPAFPSQARSGRLDRGLSRRIRPVCGKLKRHDA
jgi:hypothetical protein